MHQKTLNRLQEQMLEFDFKINYRKGKNNAAADALSRNTLIASLSDNSGDLRKAQEEDPFVRDVRAYLEKGVVSDNTIGYRSKLRGVPKTVLLKKG